MGALLENFTAGKWLQSLMSDQAKLIDTLLLGTTFLLMVSGILLCFLIYYRRVLRIEKGINQQQLERLDGLEDMRHQLELDLVVSEARGQQLDQLESELDATEAELDQARIQLTREMTQRAAEEQKALRIPQLESELATLRTRFESLGNSLASEQSKLAELQGRRDEEVRAAEEKLSLLQEAETAMTEKFENLASRIFEEKGRRFSEQNRSSLEGLLAPFKQQMSDFRQKVDEIHLSDTRDRGALREEIRQLGQQAQQINSDAVNLTRALKGDKRVQGTWGEMILERVLEQSGLRRGIEYEIQGGFRDSSHRLMKPDVIVHLPEARDVIVDSKVSLVAYEAFVSSEDEARKKRYLKEHVDAVRNHIQTLAKKDYSSLKGLRSLDFVLLFMPVEAAFTQAFQADEALFTEAFENKIVVVAPTTLIATLRTIENLWRYERQNENAKIIADRAGALYDKLRGMVDEFERLGKQLNTLQNTYSQVMNRMTQGSGNLISQASGLLELGVRVRKPISDTILAQVDELGVQPSKADEVGNLEKVTQQPEGESLSSRPTDIATPVRLYPQQSGSGETSSSLIFTGKAN